MIFFFEFFIRRIHAKIKIHPRINIGLHIPDFQECDFHANTILFINPIFEGDFMEFRKIPVDLLQKTLDIIQDGTYSTRSWREVNRHIHILARLEKIDEPITQVPSDQAPQTSSNILPN